MFAFRLCRITATLIHRAYFLLLADFFIGSRWFMINGFTGIIDFFTNPHNTNGIWSITDPQKIGAAVGMSNN